MKNIPGYLVLMVGSFVLVKPGMAAADTWTGSVNIQALQTTRLEATSSISISGTCVSSQYAYLSGSEANHDEVLTMLLSAMLANKTVKLYCSDTCASTDRCRVLNVEIVK